MGNLKGISTADLQAEMDRRAEEKRKRFIYPESPVGWWKVTTEGDCEGRSVTHLGTHYGHICEIDLGLAGAAYYGLHFEEVAAPTSEQAPRDTAVVYLGSIADIKSNIVTEAEARKLAEFLGADWSVVPHNYFQTVKVSKEWG